MGLVVSPSSVVTLLRPDRARQRILPPDIAFLREYGVPAGTLAAAVQDAERQGVEAAEALLAAGTIPATRFYCCLAHLLDLPFHLGHATLAPRADADRIVHEGRARLADGRWLLAPTGATLRLLVSAAAKPDRVPRRLVITTPAHLEALALGQAQAAVARRASLALPSLAPAFSARGACDRRAVAAAVGVIAAAWALLQFAPVALAAMAGALFLAAVSFRWIVCVAGLPISTPEPPLLPDAALPRYSVLVPVRHEAGMIPGLIDALGRLDYPRARIEVLLLVEADDMATRAALAVTPKPPWMRTIVVPPGEPRTKPRALNVGLALARGTLVTVYDAEDRPERMQLRDAAARYAVAPASVACLQARLAISAAPGLLPRMFALEYAGLFDLYNVGLARLGLPLPLGGTSNHFRASALRDVGGWDAWNVTEDADLGLRMARFGHRVEVLASTTWEEAPERLGIWVRQRRRWTKGWMQVALVLARDGSTWRDLGAARSVAVALMLANLVVGPLATPLVVGLGAWSLWRYGAPTSGLAPLVYGVPALAVVATLWCGWAGMRARGLERLAPCLPLLLPYQLLVAIAAWGGLWDLAVRPYHWRKTPHGAAALSRSSPAAPPPPRRARRRSRPG